MITLASPIMLLGLVGLSLPIAAHLLQRRASRRIIFPTIRLLNEASTGRSRLSALRRLLLLALRCLAVALLVLAFTQPIWSRRGATPPAENQGVGLVLVIDNTASAGQRAAGVPLTQMMRATALRVLAELKPGIDSANIVFASPTPRAVLPALSARLDLLDKAADTLVPGFGRAEITGAIAIAGEQLAQHAGPRRIAVLSDMQATNWDDVRKPKLPEGVALTLLPLGAERAGNVGLSRPRMLVPTAIAGRPTPVAVTVANHSDSVVKIRLAVSLDDQPLASQWIDIEPWRAAEVAFEINVDASGPHRVTFAIPDDALAADNAAYLVVNAAARASVAVITDDNPSPTPGGNVASGAYFLARALAPRNDTGLAVRVMKSNQVDAVALADAQAIFIDRVQSLSAEAADAIAAFARRGGGVAVFVGPNASRDSMRTLARALGGEGALPWQPSGLQSRDGGFHITDGLWNSPLFREFDERSKTSLAKVRFEKVWSIAQPRGDATTLLKFADGTPALSLVYTSATSDAGEGTDGTGGIGGRVLMANFSASSASGDFGKHGVFVALTQAMIDFLRPRGATGGRTLVGQPIHFEFDATSSGTPQIVKPDGSTANTRVSPAGEATRATLQADMPGFYQFVRGDGNTELIAVSVDPRESDLRRSDAAKLAAAFGGINNVEVRVAGEHGEQTLALRGRPVWHWLAAAALGTLGLEMLLLAWWKR